MTGKIISKANKGFNIRNLFIDMIMVAGIFMEMTNKHYNML